MFLHVFTRFYTFLHVFTHKKNSQALKIIIGKMLGEKDEAKSKREKSAFFLIIEKD